MGKAVKTCWLRTNVCHGPTAIIHVSRAPLQGWSCTFSCQDSGLYQALIMG